MTEKLLASVRNQEKLTFLEECLLVLLLSIPAIMAQLSSVIMQYIDASMVGQLGPNDSAAIGLVSSTTWLIFGLITASCIGFHVQIARAIGANDEKRARNIMKMGLIITVSLGIVMGVISAFVSPFLPKWLGGHKEIIHNATMYFLIFAIFLPFNQLNRTATGMIQCSGNMKLPSFLNIMMCVLDVILNALLIFPTRKLWGLTVPGAGMGVAGAALATGLSQAIIGSIMVYYLCKISSSLKLRKHEALHWDQGVIKEAMRIAAPVAVNEVVYGSAQMTLTRIISPLGPISLAAHSFAVTAESVCYMPGYGIGSASTTLIGQTIGAKRKDLTIRFAYMATVMGMVFMSVTGILMYIFAPVMIGMLSPDAQVCALGAAVLRIEAVAEPFFAAYIVITGICRGAGDTFTPSIVELICMWGIRIPFAMQWAPKAGLSGAWHAMRLQLIATGIILLIHLYTKRWLRNAHELYS